MKSVHIRDIDERTLQQLKRLAQMHHRSLQGELRSILEQAARMAQPGPEDRALRLVEVDCGGESTWSREEIYGPGAR